MSITQSSGNNAKRIVALRALIDLLRTTSNGLSILDICEKMKLSESGAKGYMHTLLGGSLVERTVLKEENRHPRSVVRLTATQLEIDIFLKTLRYVPGVPTPKFKAPPGPEKVAKAREPRDRLTSDPSRHFHVLGDDEVVTVRKPHVRIPPRDELLAALFGPARVAA